MKPLYMLVLALDTCDVNGSVALLRDEVVLGRATHREGEEYSAWLLPSVERLLSDASLGLADVDLFAAATGPGSFTGVRIGLTTVKAWGEVFGKPIAGMSRLEVLASQDRSDAGHLAAVLDAHRGQVFAALFARGAGGLTLVGSESVTTAADFLALVNVEAGQGEVGWVAPHGFAIEEEPLWASRAGKGDSVLRIAPELAPLIGKLGIQRALDGRVVDALSLDANYVRRSYVEDAAAASAQKK